MKVSELFQKLSYSELSNLALSNDGDGTIQDNYKPKVLNAINDGLRRLFDRFNLLEKDVIIQMYDHITFYHLNSKYAETNYPDSGVPHAYIKDTPGEPFLDDAVKILAAYNGHGHELPINDDENEFSLYTPKPLILQVPLPTEMGLLCVRYQARHMDVHKETDVIDVPVSLEEALRAFVAHKIYSQINTQEAVAIAMGHLQMYESLCTAVTEHDLVNSSRQTTNLRFALGGWK